MESITFVCGVVACLIGILTFIVGMNNRAKADGEVVQKLNQAVSGISELKSDVKDIKRNQQDLALLVNSHEQQIKTLFHNIEDLNSTHKVLIEILNYIKQTGDDLHGHSHSGSGHPEV